MVRTAMRPALLIAGSVLLALLPVGPAQARPGDIGVSRDGRTWQAALHRPLFAPAIRWVPGDVRTAHFFVRNQGPSGAVLTVAARVRDRQGLHAPDRVRLEVRDGTGAWQPLRNGRVGTRLGHLDRSATTRVRVRARFVAPAANPTMRRSFSFRILARLTQAHDHHGSGDDNSTGSLPDTGAPDTGLVIALALLLLAGGATLTIRKSAKETA